MKGNFGPNSSVRKYQPTPESPKPCNQITVAVCFSVGSTMTVDNRPAAMILRKREKKKKWKKKERKSELWGV